MECPIPKGTTPEACTGASEKMTIESRDGSFALKIKTTGPKVDGVLPLIELICGDHSCTNQKGAGSFDIQVVKGGKIYITHVGTGTAPWAI